LTRIVASSDKFPTDRTIRTWVAENPAFASDIARARIDGHDAIAERTRGVARGDVGAGSTGDVQRDKLIIDTDLKLLAKWDPRRYGERLALDHDGKLEISIADPARLLRGK